MREKSEKVDRILLFMPVIFAVISIIMIGSTLYRDTFVLSRELAVQTAAFILGAVLIFIILMSDYEQFAGISGIMYCTSILLMLLVYTPLGIEQYGSRAWIDLGITTLQPCEFTKILFAISYANYLSVHRDELQTFRGLIKAVLYASPVIILILKEDLGNALVVIFMMIVMIYAAGVDFKLYAKCAAAAFACLPLVYFCLKDHQKQRIDAFLHPGNKSLPGNYQVWNSKVAVGSGGFTGKGLFKGTQKSLDFLPVAKSDFIFSVICEEAGFIGGACVIGLYAVFMYRIAKIAENTKDMFGQLIVTGLGSMFFFQIFENIGMTTGIMPVTGITLPFISYGGTSVIANMIALGIILMVGKRSRIINF